MAKIWGIDLGGTKIEGIVLDPDNFDNVYARQRVPTYSEKGYEHTLNQISLLIDKISNEIGESPTRIGMGTPGSIDPVTQLLKNSNSWSLNDKPFKKDVEAKLGIPVEIANDANCFALAETKYGVVQKKFPNAKTVFGVIMGTGCGGGIVFNHKKWEGALGIAGEWGHNYLDDSGGECYCGKIGCTEAVISGPALEAYYHKISGKSMNMKEIYRMYRESDDKYATATLDRLFYFFAKGISVIVNILDPDVIVLGGGLGNIEEMYTKSVSQIPDFVFNPTFNTPVVKPILGDSAGVYGAAMLVLD